MAGTQLTTAIADDAAQTARVRILVVDDSPASREYITGVLNELPGVQISVAENGAQALRALAESGISLVLCDYEMPDMSGLQVLRFARKAHTALALPVLMLTSRDDAEMKVKAFRAGANDYIGKQAPPEELRARIGTQIELLRAQWRLGDARIRRAEHQKFEAIGHLAEGLAHELNTPAQYIQDNLAFLAESFDALGAVIAEFKQLPSAAERSLVETVLERVEYDYLVSEVPRCIGESKTGIDHVARVVAMMREFARPGLAERQPTSLNELIRGAIAVTHGQWHQVAELKVELNDSMPPVQCVATAIKQVVLYALMNAVKAMARRGTNVPSKGQLRVATRVDGSDAVIEIEDNGLGMADTTVARVMNPVLGSSPTEESGQALAHLRSVVIDEHHGRIDIRSSPEGTKLAIWLPLVVRERPAADSADDSGDASAWG